MPTPHTILAESKINWRRAALLFGVFAVIALILQFSQQRMGPSPILGWLSLIALFDRKAL